MRVGVDPTFTERRLTHKNGREPEVVGPSRLEEERRLQSTCDLRTWRTTIDTLLVGLILAPLLLCVVLVLPRWTSAGIVGLLSVLFRAVSVLGTPVYFVAAIVLPALRARRLPVRLRSLAPFAATTITAALVSVVVTLWSSRVDTSLQTATMWIAIPLLAVFFSSLILTEGMQPVGRFLALLLPGVVAQAVSTIIFRFSPSTEESYYRSTLSTIFIGRTGQELYTTDLTNNVLNPDRAGGFLFTNLNRASMVMGVMLIAYLAYGWISRKRWVWLAILPLAAAIAVGGSKTGLALLVLLPTYSAILALASRSEKPAQRMGIVLTSLIVLVVAVQVVLSTADDYVSASEATLLPRLQLWSEALRAIGENWVLGLGFGGWYDRWEAGGVQIAFSMRPAHNWVLQAWLDGGLAYVLVSVAYVIVVVLMQMRAVQAASGGRMKFALALAGSGLLWPIIHALGDNSPIFGDPPALTFVTLLAALLLVSDHFTEDGRIRPLDATEISVGEGARQPSTPAWSRPFPG